MKKHKMLGVVLLLAVLMLNGCRNDGSRDILTPAESNGKGIKDTSILAETEIQVFIAASLNTVMNEIAKTYNDEQPNVKITFNADSSGKLMTQIQEGYECDIFFSADQKQMNELESGGYLIEGTKSNIVNNLVVLVTLKDSQSKVKGLEDIANATSIALAGGSIPVGKYTREALVNLGFLTKDSEVSTITTKEVSDALGGVEISEQDNVSKVLIAVMEGSCEVGTTYYSDTYGYEDDLDIIEVVSHDLTGKVTYPIARVQNRESDPLQTAAADDFHKYISSDVANTIFNAYKFDTNLQ